LLTLDQARAYLPVFGLRWISNQMPPTFLYMLALGLWLCIAAFVWAAAIISLIIPATRQWAGPLASAMVGTFPGVLLAQVITLPLAACLFGIGLLAVHLAELGAGQATTNLVTIRLTIAVILGDAFLIGAMSLLGFCEGWRAGWLLAKGRRVRHIMASGPTSFLIGLIGKGR
jgi:hypothetical protein